jgi:hypothetical protein
MFNVSSVVGNGIICLQSIFSCQNVDCRQMRGGGQRTPPEDNCALHYPTRQVENLIQDL